jgi:hypothetical protein
VPRRERAAPRSEHPLERLLAAGDHRAAARLARAELASPAGPPAAQERARASLASLSPEPGAVVAGLLGLAAAAAVGLRLVLGGGP